MFPLLDKLLVKINGPYSIPKNKADNPILEEHYDDRGRRFYLSRDAPIFSEDFKTKPKSKGMITIL